MKIKSSYSSAYAGFSMAECAIALLVITIGIMGLFALFPVGLKSSREAISDSRVTIIASSILSDMRTKVSTNIHLATKYSNVVFGVSANRTNIVDDEQLGPSFPLFLCALQVQTNFASKDLVEATLTIWGDFSGSNVAHRFYTRFANYRKSP